MSRVLNPSNIEVSYWRYPAFAMAEGLDTIIKNKAIKKGDIPKGIYLDIQEFFKLVLEAQAPGSGVNPLACIASYRIASGAFRHFKTDEEIKDIDSGLRSLWETFKKLEKPRNFGEKEVLDLIDLKSFFYQIFRAAESETYEKRVSQHS